MLQPINRTEDSERVRFAPPRIGGAEVIADLRDAWRDLATRAPAATPFMTWEWFEAWFATFGEGRRLVVFTAVDVDDRLVALAPFVRRRSGAKSGFHRELSFFGGTDGAPDHLDLLVDPAFEDAVLDPLARQVLDHSGWDILRLDGISPDSRWLERLRGEKPELEWTTTCPYLPLPADWETFEAQLGRKPRYNLRSRAKRLAKDHDEPIELRTVVDEADRDGVLSALFDLHAQSRGQHGQAGAFARDGVCDFHRRVTRTLLAEGILRLHTLYVGERPIGAAYCMHWGKRAYFYQTGYDPEFAKYGPGAAIIAHAIRTAIEDGCEEFDFLRGDEAYKEQWTQQQRLDHRVWIGRGIGGAALVAGFRTGLRWKREAAERRQRRAAANEETGRPRASSHADAPKGASSQEGTASPSTSDG